ncbi:hypothetical protein PVA45_05215 [Entomospira entomophila]|uniref:Uncharacterized protein n=1 Tax=Entomospira entomophila TaxID=2719988 RepID=A0A968GC47_9SPIO|nr:hypothetical protein [Entomospira entomophilus]NIZ40898.1 hypothetical protein [Entomospira entomophilus]WDI35111.1 hypothetical protein PVA45_05215 [Entomospira entomophilus]
MMQQLRQLTMIMLYLCGVGSLAVAQQIFIPLDQDFVIFDLNSRTIVRYFHYQEHPFGVRPSISPDGVYLYYTKKLVDNLVLYRQHLVTKKEESVEMPQPFNQFRLLDNTRVLLDNTRIVPLDNSIPTGQQQLLQARMIAMDIDPKRVNRLYYNEATYDLTETQGKVISAYFLVQESQLLVQLAFIHKEAWRDYYQWYLVDARSMRTEILEGLKGAFRLNQGGASIGERPTVSYIQKN